jgi:anti-anti-sigma factor
MQITFDHFNSLHVDLQMQGIVDRQVLILSPVGSIDTYNSATFASVVEECIAEQNDVKHVVFNLGGVNYVSSTGIGVFTALLKFCAKNKTEMHLWRVQDKVFDVFQLLGFTQFIHFIQELKEIQDGFAERTIEPKIVECPHCKKTIKVLKSGKFKCGTCKGIIIVDDNMEINKE